jgi:hypothetical protein
MQYFSVNGAAEATGRDRRTVKRALRNVEPDSHVKKSPRWKLATIEDALARNSEPPRNRDGGSGFATLDDALEYDRKTLLMFDAFNHGLAKLQATESLAKRRKMVGPLTKVGEAATAGHGRYSEHCAKVGSYSVGGAECMYDRMINLLADACEWSTGQVWAEYWKLTPDEE